MENKVENQYQELNQFMQDLQKERIENLYKELDDFIADMDYQEYKLHEQAFIEIKTLLHQKMR